MVELGAPLSIPTSPGATHRRIDLGPVGVCSAHGEASVRRLHLAIPWRPVREDTVELGHVSVTRPRMVGNGTRALRHVVEVVLVETVDWPVCARCRWQRRRWIWSAALLLLGGLASFGTVAVLAVVRGEAQRQLVAPALGGMLAVLLATIPFVVASWLRITRARGTPDGSAVLVDDPHPAFRAAVAASFP